MSPGVGPVQTKPVQGLDLGLARRLLFSSAGALAGLDASNPGEAAGSPVVQGWEASCFLPMDSVSQEVRNRFGWRPAILPALAPGKCLRPGFCGSWEVVEAWTLGGGGP